MTTHEHAPSPEAQPPNGIAGKVRTISPFLVFGFGALMAFGGSYVGGLQHNASNEAEMKQILVQHDEAIKSLQAEQENLRRDVVPRSEHKAMLKDNAVVAHWIEKYNDAVQNNLQHQIDELRAKK